MRVISIGEILWDLIGGTEYLGGAPFNLCVHLTQLGHQTFFVSGVGDDERGKRALETVAAFGIETKFITVSNEAATGVSEIILDEEGKATHHLPRPAAYDFSTLDSIQRAALEADAPNWICYGTLFQIEENPRALTTQLFRDMPGAKRFFDINLRPRCWNPKLVEELLHLANAVKLNDDEVATLSGVFDWPSYSTEQFAAHAAQRFGLDMLCITRGADGCALWRQGEYVESPGFAVEVSDTVGAGDAFSSALLHGLDQNWPLSEIAEFANRVGALVAGRAGATPAWTEEEARALVRRSSSPAIVR
jgi:fructokinase